MMGNKNKIELIYSTNDKPKSTRDTVVYTIQWIFIMFYPVIWGYVICGLGLGMTGNELASYMGRIVFMIGVSTLVQVLAGHKLALLSGPNIIPSFAIVSAFAVGGKEYALQSFNAYIIAGVVVAILGGFGIISYIGKVWTPLVSGCLIMMIGLTSAPVGLSNMAKFGASPYFVFAIALALLCGIISLKGKGMLASIPVLIAIVLGYVVFIASGEFDWSLVKSMPLITTPTLFPYGFSIPPIDLIITMVFVNIFSAINLYGSIQGYSDLVDIKLSRKDERRYFTIFGLVDGVLAGLLGVPGYVAYGENLGMLLLTRVAAKTFIIIASVFFVIFSFIGPVGGVMAAMPTPVAGAVLLGVSSTLIGLGASNWFKQAFGTREIFIVGFSVFLAIGIASLPGEFYATVPRLVGTIMNNSVIMVIITSVVLEQIVFRKKTQEPSVAK